MKNMDLDKAYEIAGGYVEADKETFDQAIELIEKHDKELAEMLVEARMHEDKAKQKRLDEERLSVSADALAENTEFLYNELDNHDFEKSLLEDEEIKLAIDNTPIIDNKGANVFELSKEEKEKYIFMLVEKTKLDIMCEQSRSAEFSELSDEEKRRYLAKEMKTSFLGSLMHLRTAAQITENIPNAEKALKEDDEEFFRNQQLALGNMTPQDRASDFEQKIDVHADLVIASCAETENNASKYAKKLADLSEKAKSSTKTLLQKASGFITQAKSSFANKARQVWGQRYEFANNMRDRAPKTITDIAAVGGLIGATALNAPWLGTAVVAYGAYKVASSWVWPIITKARKEARLAKDDKSAKKVKFMDRLRNASKSIFSNKEERKEYFKEAGWGSAAGLVGLGAAGAVASGTFGAVGAFAARGAQRLASMAVSSVQGAINTIGTLKNKKKDFWDKAFAVAGFGITAAILTQCADLSTESVDTSASAVNATETATTETEVVSSVETEVDIEPEVASAPVAPQEWSSESGITQRQWNRLQTFWGGPEKYQEYYSRITDDMLQPGGAFEGMTRDEVLFKYERMSSWNLLQHKDAIAKFDSFFECKTVSTLTYQDGLVLDTIMDDGSILGVKGETNTVVTSRDINCGGESTLSVVKGEVKPSIEPVVEEPLEVTEEKQPTNADVQLGFDNVGEQTTTIEETKPIKVDIYKSNNLEDGKLVSSWETGDLNISTENKEIVTDISSSAAEVPVDAGSASVIPNATNLDGAPKEELSANDVLTDNTSDSSDAASQSSSNTTLVEETSVDASGDVNAENVVLDWENAEVVPDSSDVVAGTPAAGNVEERGGYNNSGITQRQYETMQTFFRDRYGDNAYEFFSSMITDEMRAKGGVFEGLSVEQSMFSVKQMVAWSHDQHGEFSQEITATMDYLKGCREEISPDMAPSVKEVIDRVNENGTIDGVTGTRNVVVRYYQTGDCGQAGTYSVDRTDSGITRPSTDGFNRLYLRPIPVVTEEPVQIGFDVVEGNEYKVTEEKEFNISIVKSNNLDDGKVIAENVSLEETNIEVEDRDIVVERRGASRRFNPRGNHR